jgi:hypothetical protein
VPFVILASAQGEEMIFKKKLEKCVATGKAEKDGTLRYRCKNEKLCRSKYMTFGMPMCDQGYEYEKKKVGK